MISEQPQKINRLISILATICSIIVVCAYYGSWVPALSVDQAWHYILVDYLATVWTPFSAIAPHTRDMVGYPPIAHAIAALGGLVTGSNFLAMHFASLGFVVLTYVFLFKGLAQRSVPWTLLSSSALVAILLSIRTLRATYGNEISGNFFFTQAAGEAATLGLLWWYAGRKRNDLELITGPVFVIILGSLYPIAQVKFAIGLLALWMIGAGDLYWQVGRVSKPMVLRICILGAALVACTVLHPTFQYMRHVADHNGGIYQSFDLRLLVTLSVVLTISGFVFALWALGGNSSLARPMFLASAAVAAGGASSLQSLAYFVFGIGSEYAVRKYVYGVTTLLIALSIAMAADLLARFWSFQRRRHYIHGLASSVIPALGAAIVVILLYSGLTRDFQSFFQYQAEVRGLAPERSDLKLIGIAISKNRDLPIEMNFIVSMVDLKIRKELAVEETLKVDIPDEIMKLGPEQSSLRYAILAPAEAAALSPACQVPGVNLSLGVLVWYHCH